LLLSSIKFGTLSQSPAQVLANLTTALPAIIAAVHGGWDNVQSLGIKSSKSASLPIWSCKLGNDEGSRWHGLTLEAEDGEDSEDDEPTSAETPPTTEDGEDSKDDEPTSAETRAKAIEQPPVQGTRHKRAAEVSEPPSQKKLKKVPSEPTAMGPLTTPKSRKGSKVRIWNGVKSCHLTNQNQGEPPHKPNRYQEGFSLADQGCVNDG
jgi:ribosome biogenesis protein UTP30